MILIGFSKALDGILHEATRPVKVNRYRLGSGKFLYQLEEQWWVGPGLHLEGSMVR